MSAYSASVGFPSLGTTESNPRDLQIIQEEYKHDLAIYSIERRNSRRYRTGEPVVLSWASGRQSSLFTGYIHHVESEADSTRTHVWCRGVSGQLDNGAEYSFRHRTVPSAVAEVAARTGFDVQAESHGQVFDPLVMDGVIWTTLVRYAKDIGYSFYAKNTRLHIHPRTAMIERHRQVAPVFGGVTLREFLPIAGAAPAGQSRAHRVVTGIDRRTGGRFRVTGGVAPSRLGTTTYMPTGSRFLNETTGTPEGARWKLAAMAENERYAITAEATVDGAAQVHQTWPVILNTSDEDYRGLWFVKKVVHKMQGGDYSMELELGKDALRSNIDIPDARAKRVLVTRNNPQGRPKVVYPPTVLVDGQWRSQWSAASRTFKGA